MPDAVPKLTLWLASSELDTLLHPSQVHHRARGTLPAGILTLATSPLPAGIHPI